LKTRLRRPLLAVAVAGALLAGGVAFAGPAVADDTPPTTAPTTTAVPTDGDTTAPAPDPTTTDATPPTTDPTTTVAPDPTTTTGDPTPTPSDTTPPPPPVDKTAPTGNFKLNYFSLWVGQKTTLTLLGVADNQSAPAAITRVVTWGDGTTSTVPPTQTTITKAYTKAGKFPITLTLTDEAGNAKVIKSTGVLVGVPGKFKLSTTAVWPGQRFNVTISAVPAGTTKIVLKYGNGYGITLKGKNQTLSGIYYYHRPDGTVVTPGTVTLTAVFTNKYGDTTPITAARITLKHDLWNPHVTITTPAHSNRTSAWKTIRGTATDKGSGIHFMLVFVLRASGANIYCYSTKKHWVLLHADTDELQCIHQVGVSKGKWSLGLTSLPKGPFAVTAEAADWFDRESNVAEVDRTLNAS
jgi:hypothetical protein